MKVQTKNDKEYLNGIIDYVENDLAVTVDDNFDKRSSVTSRGGRPYEYSPKEISEQMVKYFRYCADNGYPFTITALCMNIGISREGFRKLEKSHNVQFVGTIKKGRQIIEFYLERQLHLSQNPAGIIFILKNMGWSDRLIGYERRNTDLTAGEKIEMRERIKNFSE